MAFEDEKETKKYPEYYEGEKQEEDEEEELMMIHVGIVHQH